PELPELRVLAPRGRQPLLELLRDPDELLAVDVGHRVLHRTLHAVEEDALGRRNARLPRLLADDQLAFPLTPHAPRRHAHLGRKPVEQVPERLPALRDEPDEIARV